MNERRGSEARAFSGIAADAARKRMSGVNEMEMSGTRNETGERDRSAEIVGGGGRQGAVSAETEGEEDEMRNGAGDREKKILHKRRRGASGAEHKSVHRLEAREKSRASARSGL